MRKFFIALIALTLLSPVVMGQMYESDLEGNNPEWYCYTTGDNLDECTPDASDSYSSPDESAKAHGEYEICGERGISRDFDFAREPKYLEFDYRIQVDSNGVGQVYMNDSSGLRVLEEEKGAEVGALDTGWQNVEHDIEEMDKEFTLTAGNKEDTSSLCDTSSVEDMGWSVWIDDLKITSSADSPDEPSFRSPNDDATVSLTTVELSTQITDPNDDQMTVYFKDESGNAIDTINNVDSGDTISTRWQGLSDGETYGWYIEAEDETGETMTTPVWEFTVDESGERTYTGEGIRDDDYNETISNTGYRSMYDGYVNRLEDASNQLEPEMDTDTYTPSDYDIWEDSDGSRGAADQWAITRFVNWSISNRGVPYPPGPTGVTEQLRQGGLYHNGYSSEGGTYYHKDYSGSFRNIPTDAGEFTPDSVSKTDKVFGNSFAAIASENFTGDNGKVKEGDGVWIDPDDIRAMDDILVGYWQEKLVYNIDLTGPDVGIGFNLGDDEGVSHRSGFGSPSYVMYGNVYFEGEQDGVDNDGDGIVDEGWQSNDTVGETKSALEPPMCGDDRKEFLLEEMGESAKPVLGDGGYACADSQDVCVDMSAENGKIFEMDTYRNTDEPDENFGRLKNDEEVCTMYGDDEVARWYDQDYAQEMCRENDLYGSEGVRWFSSSDIQDHPAAFKGGIDDDFNMFIDEERQREGRTDENIESRPDMEFDSSDFPDYSPVPTGSLDQENGEVNDTIATLGFCGGDDEGEYMVTQDCQADECETDNDVVGVASSPDHCILDGGMYSETGSDKRELYSPGDEVEFDYGQGIETISCYGGTWYQEWPIVLRQDVIGVPLGEERAAQFQIINPTDSAKDFDIELRDDDSGEWKESWSWLPDGETDRTQEMVKTVEAQSSRTFTVNLYGGNVNVDDADVTIAADSDDGTLSGSDTLEVNVTPAPNATTGGATGSNEVPGLGTVQIIVMMILASTAYFFGLSREL